MKSFIVTIITSFLWVVALAGFSGPRGVVKAAGAGASASIRAIAFVTSPLGVIESDTQRQALQAPNNSSVIIHSISGGIEYVRSFEIHQAAAFNGLTPVSVTVPFSAVFDEIANLRTFRADNSPTIISIIYTEN